MTLGEVTDLGGVGEHWDPERFAIVDVYSGRFCDLLASEAAAERTIIERYYPPLQFTVLDLHHPPVV